MLVWTDVAFNIFVIVRFSSLNGFSTSLSIGVVVFLYPFTSESVSIYMSLNPDFGMNKLGSSFCFHHSMNPRRYDLEPKPLFNRYDSGSDEEDLSNEHLSKTRLFRQYCRMFGTEDLVKTSRKRASTEALREYLNSRKRNPPIDGIKLEDQVFEPTSPSFDSVVKPKSTPQLPLHRPRCNSRSKNAAHDITTVEVDPNVNNSSNEIEHPLLKSRSLRTDQPKPGYKKRTEVFVRAEGEWVSLRETSDTTGVSPSRLNDLVKTSLTTLKDKPSGFVQQWIDGQSN